MVVIHGIPNLRRSFPWLVALALMCVMPTGALAGDLIKLYGGENAGTAGAQFLRVPVGARAVSMGKAYSSLATDGSAPFWNPAGIMRTPGRKNFFASHTEYAAGIDLNHLSLHHRRQNYGFAISAGILSSGDILRTTEFHQDGTDQYFDADQFFLGLSLARAMTDRFSIGGTVKYYQENLDEWQIKSLLLDMGILYYVGFGDVWIGFTVRNFGGDLQPGGTPPVMADGYDPPATEFQKFPAPTEGSFGASKNWDLSDKLDLVTTADFNHPSDNVESFRFGTELDVDNLLFLRVGYETGRPENGFSAGFGLQLKRQQFQFRVDYAYADMGSFGTVHYISMDLSPLWRKKNVDPLRGGGR